VKSLRICLSCSSCRVLVVVAGPKGDAGALARLSATRSRIVVSGAGARPGRNRRRLRHINVINEVPGLTEHTFGPGS
jgi:hypothetical protein